MFIRQYRDSNVIQIPEVIIKGRRKSERLHNEYYLKTNIPDLNFLIAEKDTDYYNLKYFLTKNIPGSSYNSENQTFQVRTESGLMNAVIEIPGVDWRFLEIEQLLNLPMNLIEEINVSYKRQISGIIPTIIPIIKISIMPGALEVGELYKINKKINGYYEARVFYSPTYKELSKESGNPDFRSTIYWKPDVETNENGEAEVKFYNGDNTNKIRAAVEGITANGGPVIGSASYSVK